jgi:hypothetical protein
MSRQVVGDRALAETNDAAICADLTCAWLSGRSWAAFGSIIGAPHLLVCRRSSLAILMPGAAAALTRTWLCVVSRVLPDLGGLPHRAKRRMISPRAHPS